MIRVMTFNVRGGLGLDRQRDTERIAALVHDAGPDIVCFQEIHQRLPWSGWTDQPKILRRALRMDVIFQSCVNTLFGGYGLLIAARYPLSQPRRVFLPSRGERRGALGVTVAHPDGPVRVWCTHWGLHGEERLGQARTLAAEIGREERTIVCGDFNEPAQGAAVRRLREEAHLQDAGSSADAPTYPADHPRARIDFILHSDNLRLLRCETLATNSSDHRPVVCDFAPTK